MDNFLASISLIRTISLVLIISCHITQWFGLEIAWWLNAGVQIFLLISGFLYGQKQFEVKTFMVKRLKKILIPYYIVYIVAVLFCRQYIELKYAIGGLLLRSTIKGGQHLWFVPTIILCYLITPFLQVFRPTNNSKKDFAVYSVACFTIVSVIFGVFQDFFNPAWIGCYVIGYIIGVNNKNYIINEKLIFLLSGIVTIIGNGIQIWCSYIRQIKFIGYQYFCDYNHVILGLFLFLLMKQIFDNMKFNNKFKQYLNIMDKYSYGTYLVHQFLIIGPFSLMALTDIRFLNIVIIIIGIGILAFVLHKAESSIIKVGSRLEL